jgi:hypothetical protein
MDRQQREQHLRKRMEASRREYNELTNLYDSLLAEAHNYDHGSPSMVEALKKANAIGPRVLAALIKYNRSVEALAKFYAPTL